MYLQILPPDFEYATETPLINNAEVLSLALVTLVFGIVLVYNLVKNKDSKFFSKTGSFLKFIIAIIKRDLKIN